MSKAPQLPWPMIAGLFLALTAVTIGFGESSERTESKRKEDLPGYNSPFPITQPKLFAEGFVSTSDFESHPAFTPDGRTLYFVKSTPDGGFSTILHSRFVDGGWSVPNVAAFSGKNNDTSPFITADDTKLYYASTRALDDYIGAEPRDNMDLWVMERNGDSTWSAPKNLGSAVNSPSDDWGPSVASDGTIYFASKRPGGKGDSDLWRCRFVNGAFTTAENLGDSLNTAGREQEPWIAPDQSWIVFAAAGHPDSRGGLDLYVSYARKSGWSKPRNLGDAINSKADDDSPVITPDGGYFFWTSCRSFVDQPIDHQRTYAELLPNLRRSKNGLGDIYQIDRSALGLKP